MWKEILPCRLELYQCELHAMRRSTTVVVKSWFAMNPKLLLNWRDEVEPTRDILLLSHSFRQPQNLTGSSSTQPPRSTVTSSATVLLGLFILHKLPNGFRSIKLWGVQGCAFEVHTASLYTTFTTAPSPKYDIHKSLIAAI